MSYLVNLLFSSGSFVEPVGAVENDALLGPDVFVSVHNAGRDDEQHRFVYADDFGLMSQVCGGFGSIVPEKHLEVGRADETETVGLIGMLMRATCDAGLGHGDVGHDRMKLGRQLIMTKQFAQPTARVVVFLERLPDNTVD